MSVVVSRPVQRTGTQFTTWVMLPFAAVAGVVVALQPALGIGFLGALVLLGWIAAICTRWRIGVLGLLAYVPLSGVVTIALYPASWAALSKDVLFVIPIYVGFFFSVFGTRIERRFGTLPPAVIFGLGVLCISLVVPLAESLIANPLVAMVGIKVWILYVPLMLVAFYLFRSSRDVDIWLRTVILTAFIPAIIGIIEAVIIYSGHPQVVYGWYGVVDVTAGQYLVGVTEDFLVRRISSTFTFVTQFYDFLFCMVPLTLALAFGDPRRVWRRIGFVAAGVVIVAGLLSGARGFFVWLPVLLVLMLVLSGKARLLLWAAMVGVVLVLLAQFAAPGTLQAILTLTWSYLIDVNVTQLLRGWTGDLFGNGLGTSTGAARYVLADPATGAGIESWYGKQLYELGMFGLLAVAGLWIALIYSGWSALRRIQDSRFRYLGAALLTLLISIMGNLMKGPLLDLDPINMYFWLFAGCLLALPRLRGRAVLRPANASGAS